MKDRVSSSALVGVMSGRSFAQEPCLCHLQRAFRCVIPAPPSRDLAHLKDQMVFLHFRTDNQLFVNSAFKSEAEMNLKMRTPICGRLPETEPSSTV